MNALLQPLCPSLSEVSSLLLAVPPPTSSSSNPVSQTLPVCHFQSLSGIACQWNCTVSPPFFHLLLSLGGRSRCSMPCRFRHFCFADPGTHWSCVTCLSGGFPGGVTLSLGLDGSREESWECAWPEGGSAPGGIMEWWSRSGVVGPPQWQ